MRTVHNLAYKAGHYPGYFCMAVVMARMLARMTIASMGRMHANQPTRQTVRMPIASTMIHANVTLTRQTNWLRCGWVTSHMFLSLVASSSPMDRRAVSTAKIRKRPYPMVVSPCLPSRACTLLYCA